MLTVDEVKLFDVFAGLEPADYEQIIRIAGVVTLKAGDYAVLEGNEAALFGVLDGHIEVLTGSVMRPPVGQRQRGDILGEIPLTVGIAFAASYRAREASRLFHIAADAYHELAGRVPAIEARVRDKANYRLGGPGGLQALVAASSKARAVVLGHPHERACAELRHFLDRNQVRFQWLRPGVPEDRAQWAAPVPEDSELPAIRIVDGETLLKPPLRRVAELLDIATEPASAEYDTVIVGAGPAGLAAAVYGASEGLRTIVIECDAPGGQAGSSSRIENYLGFPSGISGNELSARALRQAHRLGAEVVVTRQITRIDPASRELHLDGGKVLTARTIILACGVSWRQLAIEGFDRFAGRGIFYGASRSEAASCHDLDIHIVGAGNSAGQAAMFFSGHARSVTILYRGDSLAKNMSRYLIDQIEGRSNIHVRLHTEVRGAFGDASLEEIDLLDTATGDVSRVKSGAVFIFIGADPETRWLPPEIALDPKRFVLTGPDLRGNGTWTLERDPYLLETSVPGIFACGDIRSGPVKRVAAAVGEGSMAIAFVHRYLKDAEAGAKT